MIPKVLDQIGEADINALIGTEETPRIDFKSELPKSDGESSQRFLADICAFANTEGGDIVYGLEEDAQGLGARVVAQAISVVAVALHLTLCTYGKHASEALAQLCGPPNILMNSSAESSKDLEYWDRMKTTANA